MKIIRLAQTDDDDDVVENVTYHRVVELAGPKVPHAFWQRKKDMPHPDGGMFRFGGY